MLAIALAALLVPTNAAAVDSDLKHLYVFEIEASNGRHAGVRYAPLLS